MDYSKLLDIYKERFLPIKTLYSLQHDDNYIRQVDPESGKPLFLTDALLIEHLQGKKTLAVQPIAPDTQLVKFGGIDLDSRDSNRPALEALLPSVQKLQAEGAKYGISFSVAYSGRRGFHLYTFPEQPIPAEIMRKCLFNLGKEAKVEVKEVFPYGDNISLDPNAKYYQGIKLVGGKHQKGSWSGFVDLSNLEWEGDTPKLLNLEKALNNLPYSSLDSFYKLAFLHRVSNNDQKGDQRIDWSLFSDEHPNCISFMLASGIPFSLEYNKANMTIARYAISRKLSQASALALAASIASKSQSHPTSKTTAEDKLRNFKSVYHSMLKDPAQATWQCSYIWGNIELRKQCLGCPLSARAAKIENRPHLEFNQADEMAESEVIRYIIEHPEELDKAFDLLIMSDCFMTTKIRDNKAFPVAELTFAAMEECRGDEIRVSTILSKIEESAVGAVAEYLQEIMQSEPCQKSTFNQHLKRIQDNGNRLAAINMAYDSVGSFLDRGTPFGVSLEKLSLKTDKMLSKHSRGSIKPLSHKLSSMVEEMLDTSPQAIPTPSDWLNEILLGGYRTKKFYVVAAPPGAGKTTFLNACGDYATSKGFPVIELQFEMDASQVWAYSLARIARVNSRLIEMRKWLDPKFSDGPALQKKLADAIRYHAKEIAPRFYFQEADETVFPSTLRAYIKQVRADQNLPDSYPVLVLVDYLQLMLSGVQSLDESVNETLRVSRVASALKRVARSENAAIIAISDITKDAFRKAIESGRLDMGALRDSFKIAHSADSIMILMAGKVPVKSESKEVVLKDQIELAADRYINNIAIYNQLLNLRKSNPLDYSVKARYACVEFVKNRGSLLGTVLFIYEKAVHRYLPIQVPEELLEVLTGDE